ncbi:MAG TPA: hypothetical protein PKV16_04760 [Caldisericia bacterium]|nr:hypothetical protein [Caldisericia bacterium]HPF48622.1 hypothetical protein [Caldisericia bacterium]HPI83718.1 hypothetical protein [Caldisericia bacterium]HPQ93077.1 hypothetical protein [Caldisericia bacterium]HRV75090.1 hypothetical protein [Caldisericia bacterium]
MLPSQPKIQPVKGGTRRDAITSGWGNGVIHELHLPSEYGSFAYQETGPIDVEGVMTTYMDAFGNIESESGPNISFACGHIFGDGEGLVPKIDVMVCDTGYSYLVTDEILSTVDNQTYQSIHGESGDSTSDWLRSPQPVVTVNGYLKTEGTDYTVDYLNGSVDFGGSIKGDSAISSTANSGTININVVSSTGFAPGDLITVEGDTSSEDELRTVDAVSAGLITVTEALDYTHSAGNTVTEFEPAVKATYRYIEQHISEYELFPVISPEGVPLLPASYKELSENYTTYGSILRLKNPLFLNWDSGIPEGWTQGGTGVGSISQVSGIMGTSSVMLDINSSTNWYYLGQTYNKPVSGRLKFSCWVNTDSKAKIELIPTGYPTVSTELDTTIGEMQQFRNKWVRMTVVSTSNEAPIEVRLYGQTNSTDGGVTMFDGAMLCQV